MAPGVVVVLVPLLSHGLLQKRFKVLNLKIFGSQFLVEGLSLPVGFLQSQGELLHLGPEGKRNVKRERERGRERIFKRIKGK